MDSKTVKLNCSTLKVEYPFKGIPVVHPKKKKKLKYSYYLLTLMSFQIHKTVICLCNVCLQTKTAKVCLAHLIKNYTNVQ